MNMDKLKLANLEGEVMDEIEEFQIFFDFQKLYLKVKPPYALLDLTRPSCPLMPKCQNFNVMFQIS